MTETLVRCLMIGIWGLFGIVWLYVAARVVTRGILRTIRERRANRNGQET